MVGWRRVAGGAALAGLLCLFAGERTTPVQPRTIESPIERLLTEVRSRYATLELFDRSKVGQVDTRPKRVVITYEIDTHPESVPFRKHQWEIFDNVRAFYKELGIDIQFTRNLPFRPEKSRLLLRVLDEDEYIATVPSPVAVNRRSAGEAEPRERLIYYKAWASDKQFEIDAPQEFVSVSSDVLAHEIAHMFALTHVENGQQAGRYPNLMEMVYRERPDCTDSDALCSSLTREQATLMHDYLAGGRTYTAFLDAGQDLKEFGLRCKFAQDARESIERLEQLVGNEENPER